MRPSGMERVVLVRSMLSVSRGMKSAKTSMLFLLGTAMLALMVGCGGGSSSSTTTSSTGSGGSTTTTVANTVPVTVSFGPDGCPQGASAGSCYYNGIYVTVSVCQPGSTTNCTSIPNVLVDTGSVGLRVLSNFTSNLSLPQVKDPVSGQPFYECLEYGDLSYTWGAMQYATVQIGAETASQLPGGIANAGIPIQVISAGVTAPQYVETSFGPEPTPCLTDPSTGAFTGGLDDDTVQSLGANGILGIGNFEQDCGSDCTVNGDQQAVAIWPYLICQNGNISECSFPEGAPIADQAWNPVAAFSSTDTGGVVVQLPSIPAAGQATVTGTLIFGIGSQSDNAITTQTVYELDPYGNFASATLNGGTTPYTSSNSYGSYLDTGSNLYYVSDATTLGTTDCTVGGVDIYFYCPASPLNISLGLTGSNNTSGTVSLSIGNALSLFQANPTFAAFNDIGGDSGSSPSTDYFDLGLPFFFGRTVFVGITSTKYPNGYWAF